MTRRALAIVLSTLTAFSAAVACAPQRHAATPVSSPTAAPGVRVATVSTARIVVPHAEPSPKLAGSLADVPMIVPTPTPPAPLRCLEKYYEVGAVLTSGNWFAVLADRTKYPYDDGRVKTLEERKAHPDIHDAFARRYPAHQPIVPVTDPEEDDGRIRLDPVFKATYGSKLKQVDLVRITFLGHHMMVNTRAKDVFLRVEKKLQDLMAKDKTTRPFLKDIAGGFNWRSIKGVRGDRPSAHSYGLAVDLNAALSDNWRWIKGPATWKNRIPASIVEVFESEGFVWGGRWYHFDTMHFEWRPELVDGDCYPDDVPPLVTSTSGAPAQ